MFKEIKDIVHNEFVEQKKKHVSVQGGSFRVGAKLSTNDFLSSHVHDYVPSYRSGNSSYGDLVDRYSQPKPIYEPEIPIGLKVGDRVLAFVHSIDKWFNGEVCEIKLSNSLYKIGIKSESIKSPILNGGHYKSFTNGIFFTSRVKQL